MASVFNRPGLVIRRLIRALVAFGVSVLMLAALVDATMMATVRSQIVEMVQGAVLARSDLKTPEQVVAFRTELTANLERGWGLHLPAWRRVPGLAWRVVRLDLGDSRWDMTAFPARSHRVRNIVLERLPPTLLLFLSSTALSLGLGIALGTSMARRPGGLLDRGGSLAATILYGTPAWWVGSFMILLFVYTFPVFRVGALRTPGSPASGVAAAVDYLSYLALPLLTLVLVKVWGYAYIARTMVVSTLGEDFVMSARGRGIPEGAVLRRHGLRVASPGIVTLSGQALAQSVVGDILVEKIMSRPGLGVTLFSAIGGNDVALYTGIMAIVIALYCTVWFALDLACSWLDPRIGQTQ